MMRTRQLSDKAESVLERPFIRARGLGLSTPRVHGYSGVDLDLYAGNAYAVCADSRGGKTELLLTLAGRMRPTEGSLMVGAANARSLRAVASIRRASGLGFFEHVNDVEPALRIITVTAAELSLAGRPSSLADAASYLVDWQLDDLGRLHVGELSRYDLDRLGIALGLCSNPRILAVHEIEHDLTAHQTSELARLLRSVASERGMVVVAGVADHDVAALFDGAIFLTESTPDQRRAHVRKHAAPKDLAA